MNDKVLFITHLDATFNFNAQIIEEQIIDLSYFYKKYSSSTISSFWVRVNNPKKYFKRLIKSLNVIKAAGGLVENGLGAFLFIYRNKKWDLPKGKLDKGEKVRKAAQREVEEECGLAISERLYKITNTYHLYTINDEVVLKKTTWYKMKVEGAPKLVPQVEEGITKAEWLQHKDFIKVMKNTYLLIKDVLEKEKLVF